MSVTQINDYGVGDIDLTSMMETLDDQRTGLMRVSLTEIGTSTVPAVAAGSIFECNGGLYLSGTQTALGGSPSDGRVWIYFDPSGLSFTMTNTAPTWNADKNGWYGTSGTANCRYLPFITDKSGSSYTNKRQLIHDNSVDILTFETGANEDKTLQFASDASIFWDEYENEFVINKPVNLSFGINGDITFSEGIYAKGYFEYTKSDTENDVYTDLAGYVVSTGIIFASGVLEVSGATTTIHALSRFGTTISIIFYDPITYLFDSYECASGDATALVGKISIVI